MSKILGERESKMLPIEFLERMEKMLGNDYRAFLESYDKEEYKALRFNPLRGKQEDFDRNNSFHLNSVPWEENGYYYEEEDKPGKHPYHEAGVYYIQEPSAMAPVHFLNPRPGETILDLCAAPGGKSVLLAKKCGQVTSFELHEHRVELIRQYKERMGVKNVTELQKDSAVFDAAYEEKFDAVLCDAPCSGYGTVSENPDIKLFRKKEDFAALAKAQKSILSTVSRYVKKGGALYYSTCSLFACENDKTVEEFLKAHPNFKVEGLESPLSHDKKKYGLQFLPDAAYGAGFYVCKLIKQ